MLQLKHIVKNYLTGAAEVTALQDVSLRFRKSEFVSILGPSGCGKTTLLNIIGGLDRYTTGDLIINGISTKEYKDRDWDTYRNHSVGFVFQNYNLISHQTVLSNVELALTLSGVSREERRRRATEALEKVGLGDQIHKKPNQMSGGQMQRVAIARALVNDPDIILADEPTGALDTKTSIQIMEILKEISREKLIVMVTHNPDLAKEYSTRIIDLLDGSVVGDSNPYTGEAAADGEAEEKPAPAPQTVKKVRKGKRSMSLLTALSLSLNNLMTKKGRTFMTSFAGSIGIIGIALILSLSSGINAYIGQIQEETLSSYPITLQKEQVDMSGLMTTMMGNAEAAGDHALDAVYSNVIMYTMMDSFINAEKQQNNLAAFKEFLEADKDGILQYTNAIQYVYDADIYAYRYDTGGNVVRVDAGEIFESAMGDVSASNTMTQYTELMNSSSAISLWQEILPTPEDEDGNKAPINQMIYDQYELVGEGSRWPEKTNEIVLIVNENNELADLIFYALGLKDRSEITDIMAAILTGNEYDGASQSWSYEEILDLSFSLLLPDDRFIYDEQSGLWVDATKAEELLQSAVENGLTLDVVGIIRPKPDVTATAMSGTLGYTYMLTDYILEKTAGSAVLDAQIKNPDTDIFTGKPFVIDEENMPTAAEKEQLFLDYVATLSDKERAELYTTIFCAAPESVIENAITQALAPFLDTENSTEDAPVYDMAALREEVRKMLNQGGEGSDIANKYIDNLTDDKLLAYMKQAITEQAKAQYAVAMEEQLEIAITTVSDAELQIVSAQLKDELVLSDRMSKIGYLVGVYTAYTGVSDDVFRGYMAERTDDEIKELVDSLLKQQALAYLDTLMETEEYRLQKLTTIVETAFLGETANWEGLYDTYVPTGISDSTYEDNLKRIGQLDEASPASILLYASSFHEKELIADIIENEYNASVSEEDKITYTDYVALMMSGVSAIIDAITYVLIAFVAISLVVSSIMIGIITYISVLERTKEIGILRAIGASKKDISRVFNAETLIVGFTAGAIGILITVLLNIPITLIVRALTGISNIGAYLPVGGAVILVLISMALTLIAGLIPSRVAAKKDPVVALRTE